MANAEPPTSAASPLQIAWSKGKQAAWENRLPGILLWFFGVAIIVGYYNVESIHLALESLGQVKLQVGWIFAVVSTAIFGGLLPVVLPVVFGQEKPKPFAGMLISNCLFWAFKGFEVDVLYRFQAWLFGNNNDFQTVACKVFVDMVIYAPLFGLLNCVLFYIWRDNGYSFSKTRASLGKQWYLRKVLPALISNFCVWFPSVIIIYNLPLALQLPVQNLILCFWVLILVFFTTEVDEEHDSSAKTKTA